MGKTASSFQCMSEPIMAEKNTSDSGTETDAPAARKEMAPAARRALAEAEARRAAEAQPIRPKEIGGPKGPEPVRYGDWEVKGRASDF
jgi:hypothetical protein